MADSQLPNGRVGDDVEESEEYEEDEEEEEEPRLKYQRLGLSVAEILKAEMASCLAAHEKFLVRCEFILFIIVLFSSGSCVTEAFFQ
jgi:hypothetical protein